MDVLFGGVSSDYNQHGCVHWEHSSWCRVSAGKQSLPMLLKFRNSGKDKKHLKINLIG